jgi:hypothetical protein
MVGGWEGVDIWRRKRPQAGGGDSGSVVVVKCRRRWWRMEAEEWGCMLERERGNNGWFSDGGRTTAWHRRGSVRPGQYGGRKVILRWI